MKTHVLTASLLLNACLVAFTIRLLGTNTSTSGKGGISLAGQDGSSTHAPAEIALPGGFRWSNVESADVRALARNLRAAGYPEELVHDVVRARVDRLFATKLAQAKAAAPKPGYWERPRSWSTNTAALERSLYAEKTALLRQLLGDDPEQENGKVDPMVQVAQERFSFLPEEKRMQLLNLQNKYADLQRRAYADANGLITEAERDSLSSLEAQKTAEMAALLTPEEKAEYELRCSPLSEKLRNDLGSFQPSEAEFRAIYKAQAEMDAQRAVGDPASSSGDLEANFQASLRQALGDQRYAEYERCQQPMYQGLLKIAERYGLERDVAAQVLEFQQGVQAQTREVLAMPGLTGDQRQTWVQAARAETQQRLAAMLGPQAFTVYRDMTGDWIQQLGR